MSTHSGQDAAHMAHALALAARGLGRVWPNPSVGCVLVKDGRVIGRGHTAPGGRPHAEPQALSMAGAEARGAPAYVTLEPCSHHGKTGPCAQALIDAGIARVVVALGDPDPRVNGGGIDMLRAAGISVTTGVMENEARAVTAGFLSRVTRGRPYVTLKMAASLDGRIALASGESQWITGPDARAFVHVLRAQSDAVMVGGGTARADDPRLDVRLPGVAHQPLGVVVSGSGTLPLNGHLAARARAGGLWVCHADISDLSVWRDLGATTLACGDGPELDPNAVLAALGAAGLTRVLCEGGGALAASLLKADLVDEIVVMQAGMVIGGEGRAMVGDMAPMCLADVSRFRLLETRAIGVDCVQFWRR